MGQADKLVNPTEPYGAMGTDAAVDGGSRETTFPLKVLVSKQQAFLAFSVVAFPIFSWAILQYLERMTAWLYYLTIWEVVSLLAYALSFAFIESIVITLGLVILSALLPGFLFRHNFVPVVLAIILPVALAAIAFHTFEDNLRAISLPVLAAALILYGLVALALYLIVQRMPQVANRFQRLADRISILAYLYVPLSVVSLLVVIVRNI